MDRNEQTLQMAEVWKLNEQRNREIESRKFIPDGKTTYKQYCDAIVAMGRTPLPYDCLFEDFDDE